MACKIDKSRPDPYCAAPFLSPAITPDGFKMCSSPSSKSFPNIEFWNEEYMQDIRDQWINDIVPTDCEDCYLNARPVQGAKFIPNKSKIIPLNFQHLYLARSNRCDLACEMCSATISHTWDKVWGDGKVGIIDNDFDLTPYLWETENIAISGGNPVLDSKINDIIDGLDNNVVKRFLITSNGSVFPDRMLNKIIDKELKCDVLLIFSIDGPKAFNEKARLGAKQERIYKTINSVIKKTRDIDNIKICIETTGTNESVMHLIGLYEEILESIDMQGKDGPYMIGNICCYPEDLALHNANEETWKYMEGELFRFFIKRQHITPLAMQFFNMVNLFCNVVHKAINRNNN